MTLHFHDVSSFQGDYHPTGPTIAKATEGTDYIDVRFANNRSRTLAGGWPFLGYHFLRHGDIAAQVAHCVSVVGAGPVMLDVETAVDGSVATLADVEQFMDLHGRVTLVYLPQWYWSGKLGSPSLTPVAARGAGLISSAYTAYSDTGPGWNPYGGMTPVIWQWTSTPLDTNAFKGTQDQLAAVFAGQTPPTQEDDMTPTLYKLPSGAVWAVSGGWRWQIQPSSDPGALAAISDLWKIAPIVVSAAQIDHRTEEQWLSITCGKDLNTAGSGGGLTQAEVDARIAASTITPAP